MLQWEHQANCRRKATAIAALSLCILLGGCCSAGTRRVTFSTPVTKSHTVDMTVIVEDAEPPNELLIVGLTPQNRLLVKSRNGGGPSNRVEVVFEPPMFLPRSDDGRACWMATVAVELPTEASIVEHIEICRGVYWAKGGTRQSGSWISGPYATDFRAFHGFDAKLAGPIVDEYVQAVTFRLQRQGGSAEITSETR